MLIDLCSLLKLYWLCSLESCLWRVVIFLLEGVLLKVLRVWRFLICFRSWFCCILYSWFMFFRWVVFRWCFCLCIILKCWSCLVDVLCIRMVVVFIVLFLMCMVWLVVMVRVCIRWVDILVLSWLLLFLKMKMCWKEDIGLMFSVVLKCIMYLMDVVLLVMCFGISFDFESWVVLVGFILLVWWISLVMCVLFFVFVFVLFLVLCGVVFLCFYFIIN